MTDEPLCEVFDSWVGRARRTGGRASSPLPASRRSRSTRPGSAADVRTWANADGREVPKRGRISESALEAYDKAC